MSDDADWRDVTPTTPGFEWEVQMHPDGRVRHRTRFWMGICGESVHTLLPGPWIAGWPGKGLQW